MTFKSDGRQYLRSVVEHLVQNDLELSFSIVQGGFFYPDQFKLEDQEIERVLTLLKQEPYASSINRIRQSSNARRDGMIDLLVESLLNENIFEDFSSRRITLDFSIDPSSSSLVGEPVRERESSSELVGVSKVETFSDTFYQIIKSATSSLSANSVVSAKGEIT